MVLKTLSNNIQEKNPFYKDTLMKSNKIMIRNFGKAVKIFWKPNRMQKKKYKIQNKMEFGIYENKL